MKAGLNVIKATRIYRTFPLLMIFLVSAAFSNHLTKELGILAFVAMCIYASAGIQNAFLDKDYPLPPYTRHLTLILIGGALIISLTHPIIFITALVWIVLGFTYNTIARFVLFGDTTIIAVTHFALPSYASSMLLNLPPSTSIKLAGFFFITAWTMTQTKNIKGVQEDKKRKYVTLTTLSEKGKGVIMVLSVISLSCMAGAYFLFDLSPIFIPVFMIALCIFAFAMYKLQKKDESTALHLLRWVFLIFLLAIILGKSTNPYIITLATLPIITHTMIVMIKLKK